MKVKKEYIVLPVVIAALCAYLFLRNSDRTHYELPQIADISEADISKIEIDRGGASIVLKKKGSEWEISPQGYAADAAEVKTMLHTLRTLTLTALVSEKKDYNRYDLDGGKPIRVRAWAAGDLTRDFQIGKPASTHRHTFIRVEGDHRVYHARDNFRRQFDRTVEDLRDKTVLTFDPEEIREISISGGSETLVLTRREPPSESGGQPGGAAVKAGSPGFEVTWEGAGGEKPDPQAVSGLLRDFSTLECERYLEGEKVGAENPVFSIGLKGQKEYRLSILAKKEPNAKGYAAVSSERGDAFFLPEQRAEKIMKGAEQLLGERPLASPPSGE